MRARASDRRRCGRRWAREEASVDERASDARLARLERKAAASAIGSRAGGRWADAWAEGVGVSDSFDGERADAGSSSAETVAASLETFADAQTDADGGAGVAKKPTAAAAVAEEAEVRAPPPFAWAPWRRGGGAARAAQAEASRTDEGLASEAVSYTHLTLPTILLV